MPIPPEGGWPEQYNEYAQAEGYSTWLEWVMAIEAERGGKKLICGAKSRGKPTPCKAWAMPNGRCRNHGGKTPAGIASPHWKDGSQSRLFPHLPARLMAAADGAFKDPELLSVRKQIAVLAARDEELYRQLSTGESGAAWQAAQQTMHDLHAAIAEDDTGTTQSLLRQLAGIVEEGIADRFIWREIHENYEMSRRLRADEVKRLQALQASMDVGSVKTVMARLMGIIKLRVKDPQTLRLIAGDIVKTFSMRKIEAIKEQYVDE